MTGGDKQPKIAIAFVCLGNICRSPLAEGVFRELVRQRGLEAYFELRSAGTGDWHVGQGADRRMAETALRHGLSLSTHRARQFKAADLASYDYIFVMDKENLHDVLFLDQDDVHGSKVRLFREFDPEPDCYQVPDPYFGGADGFETVYSIVERTARNLLDRIVVEHGLNEVEAK